MKHSIAVLGLATAITALPLAASACSACGNKDHHHQASAKQVRYAPAARYQHAPAKRVYTSSYSAGYAPVPCAPAAPVCAPACPQPCFNPLSLVGGVVSGVGSAIGAVGQGISGVFGTCDPC